jgi:hypothetical protein
MAKIFLVCRERSETVESLIENLETDEQPLYPHLTREPSARNLLMIWASFLRIQPDLVYFLFEDDRLNWMERALVETIGALPFQPMAVSFLGLLLPGKYRKMKRLLKRADLLTLPSRQNLIDLRGISSNSKRQLRTLLAPLPSLRNLNDQSDEKADEILAALGPGPFWMAPWNLAYFQTNLGFFESTAKEKTWIFLGDRSQWNFHEINSVKELTREWKNKPFWSGHLNQAETLKLLKASQVLVLAGQFMKPGDFVDLASLAALAASHVILDTQQIELLSGLWTVGENCTLLDLANYDQQLENRWASGSLIPAAARRRTRSAAVVVDEHLNELNRWITKALADRQQA